MKAKRKAKREPVLFVRMTESEMSDIESATELAGFRTVSEYVRQALRKYIHEGVDTR